MQIQKYCLFFYVQVHNRMTITYLNNIKRDQYVNTIRIRVSRVWRPKKFQTESFDGLHYVLIDEKVNHIKLTYHIC